MLTGYEQVRSIVADIAGDKEAAARVELVLPETGVCSGPAPKSGVSTASLAPAGLTATGDFAVASAPAAGCCGGPPVQNQSVCCVKDEVAKAEGKKGCGC
jgi:hypothetical protein